MQHAEALREGLAVLEPPKYGLALGPVHRHQLRLEEHAHVAGGRLGVEDLPQPIGWVGMYKG